MRRWVTALLGCLVVLVVAWRVSPAAPDAPAPSTVAGVERQGHPDPLAALQPGLDAARPAGLASPSASSAQPLVTAWRDPALVPRRSLRVSAWFRSEDGFPLTGARLAVATEQGEPLATDRADTRGKAEARCELAHTYAHEPVRLRVSVDAPGFAQLQGRIWGGYGEALVSLGALVLPREQSVRGRLVDADGQPVAGATVRLESRRSLVVHQRSSVATFATPERVDTTDADGRFQLTQLGTLAGAALWVEQHRWVGWNGELADDAAGRFDLGDRVVSRPSVATSLLVRVVDESGRGLAGARAWVHGPADALEVETDAAELLGLLGQLPFAAAGADGLVAVPGVAAGEAVSLDVGAPGHVPRRVVLDADHALGPVEVALAREPPLQLSFRDAETGRPVSDLRLQVEVGVMWSWGPSPWITVEAGPSPGRFLVRDPAHRELRLDASAPGLGVRRLALAENASRQVLHEFELAGPRRLVLRVVDERGAPREDVRVWVRSGKGADHHTRAALEREPGRYELAGLEPGTHRLELSSEDAVRIKRSVHVGAEPVVDLGVLEQPSYGAVDLLVLGGDGLPADGRPDVTFLGEGKAPTPQVEELGQGRVSLRRLQPGPWELTMVPGGRLALDVPPGEPVATTLSLEPWCVVEGRVVRAGEPVAASVVVIDGARVGEAMGLLPQAPLELTGSESFAVRELVPVGADGRFRLSLARHDDVAILAVDARGNASPVQHVMTRPAEHHDLRLELPVGDAALEGIARELATGEPAADVSVYVAGAYVGRTDDAGRFRVEGLHARRVEVMALPTVFQQSRLPVSVQLVPGQTVRVELDVPEDDMSGLICF